MEDRPRSQRPSSQRLGTLWEVIEGYLAEERIELDDLELVGRGRAQTLRVVVDSAEEKIDLDRIAEVSRGLSRLLDHIDPEADVEGSYQLEVTSPGLERKLNRPRHFQKSVGREVVVKTQNGSKQGVLSSADDNGFTLQISDDSERVAYEEVKSARTVFTWEKPPKPGAPRSST